MSKSRGDLLASFGPITKALRTIEDRAATAAGLTMWQYAVLSVIEDAPGLNQGTVAKFLAYSPNRIVADLDLLEQRELVTRRPGRDRRENLLLTTTTGAQLMQRVRTEIRGQEDELLSVLPKGQRRELISATHTLAQALRGLDRDGPTRTTADRHP